MWDGERPAGPRFIAEGGTTCRVTTTEDECVEALREAAERLGESPTKAQYEDLGLTPASATIQRVMGGWNEAKEAAGLETYASTGSRVGSKPDGVDLPEGTAWADLSVDQRWHYRNVDWNTERTLRRRARLRRWVNEHKRERGCIRCGVDDPACLDFHHVEAGDKEMDVGTMITYGYGKDGLRDEIQKCEVLCANCHRTEHGATPTAGETRHEELRAWVHERKRERGCARCGQRDPRCLDFHHDRDEKGATVAELVSNGRSKDAIRNEVDDCIVLCANCHRKEHFEPPGER